MGPWGWLWLEGGTQPGLARARYEADGISDQAWREGCLPRHCQAQQLWVGHSSAGHGSSPGAGENCQPKPARLAHASDGNGDAHLCDFLEAEFLGEQVDGIKEIGDMITKIKRAGDGLGLHIMDKEIGS